MRRLFQCLCLSFALTAGCGDHDHDHDDDGACGPNGLGHDGHCHCNAGYVERAGVCVAEGGDGGADSSVVTDSATDVVADRGAVSDDAGPECGGHGHRHGAECHCDDGYVADGGTCIVAPACMGEDAYEPNDTGAMATPWRASFAQETLRVCAGRPDWFRVTLAAGQALTATATFTHAMGDIDLGLWPAGVDTLHRAPVARADGTVDNETLRFTATTPGDYWLGVIVYERGDLPYTLTLQTMP